MSFAVWLAMEEHLVDLFGITVDVIGECLLEAKDLQWQLYWSDGTMIPRRKHGWMNHDLDARIAP